jgi:hypothetical protein
MADDDKTKQDNSKPAGDGGAGEGAGSHGGASDNGEHMIPKSRFDEVNNRLKQLEADAEKRKADAAKADEARLADQNKHKELADKRAAERDDFKTKYEAAQQQIEAMSARLHNAIDDRIREWPEKLRAKVPGRDVVADAELRAAKVDELADLVPDFSSTSPAAGTGRGPKPAGPVDRKQTIDKAVETALRSGSYGF